MSAALQEPCPSNYGPFGTALRLDLFLKCRPDVSSSKMQPIIRQKGAQKCANHKHALQISLVHAFTGVKKNLKVAVNEACNESIHAAGSPPRGPNGYTASPKD